MAAKKTAKRAAKKDAEGRLIKANIENYNVDKKTKTPSGRPAVDSNDKVAKALRGGSLEDAYREASKATGIAMTQLKEKYGKLNPGMQRMNLGNRIRGAAN